MLEMLVLLSHKLTINTPAFAGGESMKISPIKEVEKGASSSSYNLSFQNHIGTHLDAPRHFDPNGKPLSFYSLDKFVYNNPLIIDVPKQCSELIEPRDLESFRAKISQADLLLLRTGFQKYRNSDEEKYATLNPGVSSRAARYILDTFPDLKAMALDTISLSAVQNREEGREAHRLLLRGRDFFILEDANLSNYPVNVKKVFIIPFFVVGIDSSPCTVFAEV